MNVNIPYMDPRGNEVSQLGWKRNPKNVVILVVTIIDWEGASLKLWYIYIYPDMHWFNFGISVPKECSKKHEATIKGIYRVNDPEILAM